MNSPNIANNFDILCLQESLVDTNATGHICSKLCIKDSIPSHTYVPHSLSRPDLVDISLLTPSHTLHTQVWSQRACTVAALSFPGLTRVCPAVRSLNSIRANGEHAPLITPRRTQHTSMHSSTELKLSTLPSAYVVMYPKPSPTFSSHADDSLINAMNHTARPKNLLFEKLS
jgi:hypothetical protein